MSSLTFHLSPVPSRGPRVTLSVGCHQFTVEQTGPAAQRAPRAHECSSASTSPQGAVLSPSWGFSGSQDTADPLKAVDTCAEVLACLQRRRVDWLVLFQLTETGEPSVRAWEAGYSALC